MQIFHEGVLDASLAHAEDGHLEQAIPFDLEQVCRDLGEAATDPDPSERLTDQEWQQLHGGLESLFRWIYQDPHHTNHNGLLIRTLIVAWIIVKELQPLTLTQLARMYGKDKQSFGRWVDDFKLQFPAVRNCHMKD
jgi:hypothetical protein